MRPDPRSPRDFLDAVTSDPDLAVEMHAELLRLLDRQETTMRAAIREAGDWRLRFKDRDTYARLLEDELRPLRLAMVREPEGEQEALL